MEKLKSSINKIQNSFRCHLAKEKQKNLVTQSNWNKLLKKSILKKSVEALRSAGNYKIVKISQNKILNNILDRKIFNDGQSKKIKIKRMKIYQVKKKKITIKKLIIYRIMMKLKMKNKISKMK